MLELEYAQLLTLTDSVEQYFVGEPFEKELLLLNIESLKKDKIIEITDKCIAPIRYT